jgi:DnaJ homolog subfamily C member 9
VHGGSVDELMRHIPHSTHEDEPRLISLVDSLIAKGELPKLKSWEKSARDEKSRLVRERAAKKEAKEAEALAKDLGVWDEFYGSGKEGARVGKGKASKGKKPLSKGGASDGDDGDTAALQALILKRKKNMDGFFDSLAAKYAEPEKVKKGKGKKRPADDEDEEAEVDTRSRKRTKAAPPPEIDDAEFEALQKQLFGDKNKAKSPSAATSTTTRRGKKAGKGRKA